MCAGVRRKERERREKAGKRGKEWGEGWGREEKRLDLIPPVLSGPGEPLLLLPLLPLPDPPPETREGLWPEPCPSPPGTPHKVFPPRKEDCPIPFPQNERVIWAKEKKRKIEVEKSLIWKFS